MRRDLDGWLGRVGPRADGGGWSSSFNSGLGLPGRQPFMPATAPGRDRAGKSIRVIACCQQFAYSRAMTFSVGLFRTASLLLAGLLLSGCLPSAPRDDEKEPYFLAGKSRVN